jgi:periodic tryptophan protein 2
MEEVREHVAMTTMQKGTSQGSVLKPIEIDPLNSFRPPSDGDSEEEDLALPPRKKDSNLCLWKKKEKFLFNQEFSTVSCAWYHKTDHLLIVGFTVGVFTIHEMPEYNLVHSLSVSQEMVTTVTASPSGEWLAFGCRSHGQLLVWEWASETYVLRQQGHYYDMNCMSYSPDGHVVATGGDDGKIKLWNTSTSFCFVTLSEHSGPVTDVSFGSSGHILVSASLDGTIRAFDMNRYRNFRTFSSPRPVQFSCVSLDPSVEVVCAATRDSYEVYIWSVQRGVLLEVLGGHEAPISSLQFNPQKSQLISCGWDKTLRVWSVFTEKGGCETTHLSADALAVAPRPDGEGLAVATLDGLITLWDANLLLIGTIEGRRDLEIGRRVEDKVTAKKLSGGVAFYSLCYSADGSCLLAAGRSKFICIYSCMHQVLLKKFLISRNRTFDGMKRYLNSAYLTEAGPLELISEDEESDEDRRIKLPGVAKGDLSTRRTRPVIAVHSIQFSPSGDSFAAVSTEGLLIYSIDSGAMFTPYDLSLDVTVEGVEAASASGDHLMALVLSFRLNDMTLVSKSMEAVAIGDVPLLAANFPQPYLGRILDVLSTKLDKSRHLQFYLSWCKELLTHHGPWLKDKSKSVMTSLTNLQRSLAIKEKSLCRLVEHNTFFLEYLTSV